MTEHRKFHYALVEFRPNPARPDEGRINLGVMMEFTTPEFWVVALATRAAFPRDILASLDPLSRELLERRSSVIESEIADALLSARHPGDVLKLLSERNHWSVYMTAPKLMELVENVRKADSIETIAQHYAFTIYKCAVAEQSASKSESGTKARSKKSLASRPRAADDTLPAEITPPWMITPRVWSVPRLR